MRIGRNDPCPCGSGRKFKRCCAGKTAGPRKKQAESAEKITLGGAIQEFQRYAEKKQPMLGQVGVFVLYADAAGDAWVLEVTDSDCIQIAREGVSIEVPLEENEETIVVDWSHTFSFKNKQLHIQDYREKKSEILESAPSQQLNATMRKILKRISPELLEQVHLDD